jgi:hypothetical protein
MILYEGSGLLLTKQILELCKILAESTPAASITAPQQVLFFFLSFFQILFLLIYAFSNNNNNKF